MKILINTVAPVDIEAIRAQQEKDGVKPEEWFNGTYWINGQAFVPGQWTHVPDDFDTSAYPKIMWVEEYYKQEVERVLRENGLDNFAQGLRETAEMYQKEVPAIVTDMQKYVPYIDKSVEPIVEEVVG